MDGMSELATLRPLCTCDATISTFSPRSDINVRLSRDILERRLFLSWTTVRLPTWPRNIECIYRWYSYYYTVGLCNSVGPKNRLMPANSQYELGRKTQMTHWLHSILLMSIPS
jgi:hypothetical protein